MRALMIAMIVLAVSVESSHSQVDSDNQADTGVLRPAFAQKTGPVVAVDSGHHNYHTIDNRYVPFAALLTNDGFRVVDSKNAFTPGSLAIEKVLVIANAEPVADGEPGCEGRPT